MQLAPRDYFAELIRQGYVSQGPEEAIERINSRFGTIAQQTGVNVPGIANLRKFIHGQSAKEGIALANALSIIAPHTHWPPAPIVYSWDAENERYWVGPLRDVGEITPVSFIFTPEGPLPYEWADEKTIGFANGELGLLHRVLLDVNSEVVRRFAMPFPLGLSFHFRFKSLFEPPLVPTMEVPDEISGLSYIVPDAFSDSLSEVSVGQVGWSAHTVPANLTEQDRIAIEGLQRQLTQLDYAARPAVFRAILTRLRNRKIDAGIAAGISTAD